MGRSLLRHQARHKEARQAFAAACDQPIDENFHEWRKRVKELWYDLRILGAVRPEVMDDLAYQAKVLGEYLGEDRDLAVAGRALEEKRLNKASPRCSRASSSAGGSSCNAPRLIFWTDSLWKNQKAFAQTARECPPRGSA